MLAISEINQVVYKAASTALKKARVSHVYSKPTIDSVGQEALNVTIVLKRGRSQEVTGDAALDAIVRIGQDLSKSGEDRLPIIEFATEEELESSDDTEF